MRTGGWFRVLYPDGVVSTRMTLRTALGYREIFGGRLLLDFPWMRTAKKMSETMKGGTDGHS